MHNSRAETGPGRDDGDPMTVPAAPVQPLSATVLAVFFVPVFFVVIRRIFKGKRKSADEGRVPLLTEAEQ
jgi:hypothetical protein